MICNIIPKFSIILFLGLTIKRKQITSLFKEQEGLRAREVAALLTALNNILHAFNKLFCIINRVNKTK